MNRRKFSKVAGSLAATSLLGTVSASKLFSVPNEQGKAVSYKYIDIHTHIGRIAYQYPPLTADGLVQWMDEHLVERAVVLPLVSPESAGYLQPSDRALEAGRAHPDRIIPFCCVDPRTSYGEPATLRKMLKEYADQGARGFGEHKVGLPFDHPLMMEVYGACGEVGLPVLFHVDTRRGTDRPGLPGVEHALRDFPDTTFIGHANGFWASISGDAKVLGGRPEGPVTPGGAIDRLMDKYPNLYGDLSARSGHNAMSRDPEFTLKFLIRRADRLLFGTDYLRAGQEVPQFELYESIDLPEKVRAKIFRQNAIDVLNLT